MSEVSRDIAQMRKFEAQLENFIAGVNSMCSSLERGINGLRSYMDDPATVKAMHKAEVASQNIKSVLNPAQSVLEKVKDAIHAAEIAEYAGYEI